MKATIYVDSLSGNCYKLQLVSAELRLDHNWREVDILSGETRTPEFLAKNPNGRIPLFERSDGQHLAESNAILCYLAEGSDLLPAEGWARAQIMQWLFFEQYSHEPYIGASRFIVQYLGNPADKQDDLAQKKAGGENALHVMEQRLGESSFMAGAEFSIADIALYAYTHVAHEGGFELDKYPGIRAWLQRVASRPRHIPMVKK